MAVRAFLALMTLVWLPYGLYCLFAPDTLETMAGVKALNPTANVELRAMYGGVQAAIGVLVGLALLREWLRVPALTALGFLALGLGTSRLIGCLIEGDQSFYNVSALVFELIVGVVALRLLASLTRDPATV
ncbi:DUF4345 domain-containing protein [Myxococcota bacterium]|nr:DUF4345 domain-containing protein [Myxococcota bacterium]